LVLIFKVKHERFLGLSLGTHLFVKLPRPGDKEFNLNGIQKIFVIWKVSELILLLVDYTMILQLGS